MTQILQITNESGLTPKGQAVLLLPYEPDLYNKNSIIVVPDSYKDKLRSVENRGVVLAIGPEAWLHARKLGAEPRAVVGEKVMISKYAGHQCQGTRDGKIYRMVNAEDIFCGLDDDLTLEEVLAAQGWVYGKPKEQPVPPAAQGWKSKLDAEVAS